VLVLVSALAWFLVFAIEARKHAQALSCQGHLKWLGVSIFQYNQLDGHLPPAHIDAPDGSRMHSWRALIDAMGRDQSESILYDFRERWNGPGNEKFADHRGTEFACPCDPDTQQNKRLTNYFVVDGRNTPFPGSRSRSIIDPEDYESRSNNILVAEARGLGIEWLEPRDLDYDTMSFTLNNRNSASISSLHPGGAAACMAEGSVQFLNQDISADVLKTMLNIREAAWRNRTGSGE